MSDCPSCQWFRPDENPKTGLCAHREGPLKPRVGVASPMRVKAESRIVSEGMTCERYQEKAA